MNKTKIKKFRHQQRMNEVVKEKEQRVIAERKAILVLKKKKYKAATKERSAKFFDQWSSNWQKQRANDNLAIPSVITNEWGKCTKKRSPLDDY